MDRELLHCSLKEQRTGSVSVRSRYWQFYWCDLEKKNPKIEKTYFCLKIRWVGVLNPRWSSWTESFYRYPDKRVIITAMKLLAKNWFSISQK